MPSPARRTDRSAYVERRCGLLKRLAVTFPEWLAGGRLLWATDSGQLWPELWEPAAMHASHLVMEYAGLLVDAVRGSLEHLELRFVDCLPW